jgi:TetR/AcrR family transcriptional repressor of nem operon
VARPRSFDDDTALDAAIACFWSRGLTASSVRDLAGQMGIQGPSLYNAFGDKRTLFVRALERYATSTMRERIARFEHEHDPKTAIRAFVQDAIERSVSDPYRRGCLLVNSALEVAPHDAELRAPIADYLATSTRSLRSSGAASLLRGRREPCRARSMGPTLRASCSAWCWAFGFWPARTRIGPCWKAWPSLPWPCSIALSAARNEFLARGEPPERREERPASGAPERRQVRRANPW